MKQYKKPMTLWLGRTVEGKDKFSNYQIATRKKDWTPEDGFVNDSFITSFCGADFERVTGVKLEMGEVLKVSIAIHGH